MGCQSSKTPGAGVPSAVALPNVERALEAANTRNMSCYGQLTIGGKSVEARLDHLHFVCDKSYDITGAAVTTFTSGSKCCFQLHVKDPSGPSGSTTLTLNAKDKTDLDRWVHALKFNIDGGEMVLQEDVGTRLLIVDVAVDTNQLLKQLTMDGIQVVYFDSEKDSTSVLRSKLAGVGNGYASVAFANHGPTTNGAWQISADEVVNVLSPEMKGPFFSFFAKLTGLIKDGGHIDLLACNLAGVSPDFVSSLESQYGVDVAASSNVTGNEKNGGDWIMETDGIDAAKLYFVEEKISQYAEVMGGALGFIVSFVVGDINLKCSKCDFNFDVDTRTETASIGGSEQARSAFDGIRKKRSYGDMKSHMVFHWEWEYCLKKNVAWKGSLVEQDPTGYDECKGCPGHFKQNMI